VNVRVHPGSRREQVRKLDDGSLEVWTHALAIEGRANDEVCRLVASFLGVARSSARIARGTRGRLKLVEVDD
jgi:uncharacterized protein YggU (UPF0235/DUF167 family)